MSRALDVSHVDEIAIVLRDLLASQMQRHGISPDRMFEMLSAMCFVIGIIIKSSDDPDVMRKWFLEQLDEALAMDMAELEEVGN